MTKQVKEGFHGLVPTVNEKSFFPENLSFLAKHFFIFLFLFLVGGLVIGRDTEKENESPSDSDASEAESFRTESGPAQGVQVVGISREAFRFLVAVHARRSPPLPRLLDCDRSLLLLLQAVSVVPSASPGIHNPRRFVRGPGANQHLPHCFRDRGIGADVAGTETVRRAMVGAEHHSRLRLVRRQAQVRDRFDPVSGFGGLDPVQVLELAIGRTYRPNRVGELQSRVAEREVVRDGRR